MVSGWPDWTRGVGGKTKEGNPVVSLATPPVWFKDDFNDGLLKWKHGQGTLSLDSTPGDSSNESPVLSGAACMKITTGGNQLGKMTKSMGPPPLDKNIGVEFTLYIDDSSKYSTTIGDQDTLVVTYVTGTTQYLATLNFVPSTGKWYISEDGGTTHTNVLTKKLEDDKHHRIKLTFNFTTKKYVELLVNDETVDLSAYDVDEDTAGVNSTFEIEIEIAAAAGETAIAYVDEVIITYHEP